MKSKKQPIDLDFLRGIIDNDLEFEKELFAIFVENANQNIAKMQDAVNNSDGNSWYMASHAFKGSSASIGAFNLSKILEYAQNHQKETFDEKIKILDQVKNEFQTVSDFIHKEILGNPLA